MGDWSNPDFSRVRQIITRRSGCGLGSGFNNTTFTTAKLTILGLTPSANVSNATALSDRKSVADHGFAATAYRRSRPSGSMLLVSHQRITAQWRDGKHFCDGWME
jgi:hypothetical protein